MPSPRPTARLGASAAHERAATLDPMAAMALRAYLVREGQDLIRCCAWLGGARWRARAEVLETLAERAARHDPRADALLGRMLARVHALLTLEPLDDLASPEAAIFATLDLDDPRIARCCPHAEALGALLHGLGSQPRPPADPAAQAKPGLRPALLRAGAAAAA